MAKIPARPQQSSTSTTTSRSAGRRRGRHGPDVGPPTLGRILAGGLDAHLSVIAVGLDFHDCAGSLWTAGSYEGPAREGGGGVGIRDPRGPGNGGGTRTRVR